MALEEEIRSMTDLEIGNVEKTITDIEGFKCKERSIQEEINNKMIDYSASIKQQLPKIINNIILVKKYLSQLCVGDYYTCSNGYIAISKEKNKEILEVRSYNGALGTLFQMIFDKEKNSLNKIIFRQRDYFPPSFCRERKEMIERKTYPFLPYFIRRHLDTDDKIVSRTVEDFGEKFSELTYYTLKDKDKISYTNFRGILGLPTQLNEVPREITKNYEYILKRKSENLIEIKEDYNQLISLKTLDF